MKILVITPSRGRPENAAALAYQFEATRGLAETTLLVAVDVDDPEVDRYGTLLADAPESTLLICNERMRLGGTLNFYADVYHSAFDVIGFMGDDHRPRTPEWDARVADAFAELGDTGIVYGNDLFQGENLPTAVFISTNIVRALGYYQPRELVHLFFDNFWRDLGNAAGCLRYLPDVVIEHVHPAAGKASWDERYAEVNSGEMWDHDSRAYASYRESGRLAADVQKVVALRG